MNNMDEVERIARKVMGWIGTKPLNSEYPWDVGVMPETAVQDKAGKPHGGENQTIFSRHEEYLNVWNPKNNHHSRGPAFFFNPFSDGNSAQMVVEKLGRPTALFDTLKRLL